MCELVKCKVTQAVCICNKFKSYIIIIIYYARTKFVVDDLFLYRLKELESQKVVADMDLEEINTLKKKIEEVK